jgi:predicted transcriptional regulator
MSKSKRSRVEIYADVLRALRTVDGGCRITRLSYGTNMPLDRMNDLAEELISFGLIAKRPDDPRFYVITARGIDFLDAFKKLFLFLE